jgi:hypothetical protein
MDNAASFDTAIPAYALSQALVSEARAHVDGRLNCETWMRENREMLQPSAEFAVWCIRGNNQLTLSERHQLRNYYLKSGWARVEFIEADSNLPGSWVLRFSL